MAARKQAPEPETSAPADVSGGEPSPEPAPEPTPVPAPEPVPSPEPVRKYQIKRREPYRAGGHVLTERGWELDIGQEV